MTITQLKIVILTARNGSISAAARELGIPQPNASSGIKAIEKELGFEIFNRESGGISLTGKGQLLLEHAQRILDETDRIDQLSTIGRIYQLRVGCTNYFRGREAFIKLCTKHQDENIADLQYYNVSFAKGIDLLNQHKLDVVVGLTLDVLLPTINEMAKEKHITCIELDESRVALTLSKNHPIVKEGLFENGIDKNVLANYPYVSYHTLNEDFDTPYYKGAFEIPCKYNISIEERETRFKLVRDTNAFMFGGCQSQETLDFFNLVEYDYPGYRPLVICLYRDLDKDRSEVQEFVELI